MKKYILDLTDSQLKAYSKAFIKQAYRINQILDWIYLKKAATFEEFTSIPKDLRQELDRKFLLRSLKIVKKEQSVIDGTVRYTFQSVDKKYFFAVFLPAKEKNSVCISSQIGCPIMCAFCFSGKVKYTRNLTRSEIIEQILQIENDTKEKVSGILFMGMGEPTLNYNSVSSALTSLLSKKEFALGKRHITLSTVGNVAAIKKLADDNFGIRLAVSLHATTEKQRKKIIPNSFNFSIEEILSASKYYLKKTKSRLTIEYILIREINDSPAEAHRLARLLKQHDLLNQNVQINLIPYNTIKGANFNVPTQESILKFKNLLKLSGIVANIRQAKGSDIDAACGQLGY
ncbi:MAG: 23S rRNA (adenine(2503)-C(2))-methyltransferase RlmN [Endomicrobium sp.]|jgi:23S rRNA (adenine2503-C2)-methyltransferase|nr:23S rRNA (adenine(2503)-C(2))-methyltransferase RlmN [Endomicrobium sp.]